MFSSIYIFRIGRYFEDLQVKHQVMYVGYIMHHSSHWFYLAKAEFI
ncbi:hypothetical protein C900_02039 [Fulvivirga imtechensis AK7]|uniref:Uncharacterized protein n=1 Tax=Fulvivirga imtechensis AK7 TaxID=1237149 RepID=L8JXY0_9BACT|nr:hypothetical protein C900_02039 [Fulvivirga imtechensis AK7]